MPAWEYLSKIWPTMHLEVGSLCCCWQPLDSPHLVSKVLVQEQNTNFSTGVLFSLVYCIWITSSTFLLVRRPPGGRVSSSFSPKKWRLSDLSLLRGFWASAMIISAKFIKILDNNNTNTQQRSAVQCARSESAKLNFLLERFCDISSFVIWPGRNCKFVSVCICGKIRTLYALLT